MIDPNDSDWSDLDLLTRDEVQQRLRAAVTAVEAELADLVRAGASAGPAAAGLLRRLDALKARLAQ
jgi:hypothetical protein